MLETLLFQALFSQRKVSAFFGIELKIATHFYFFAELLYLFYFKIVCLHSKEPEQSCFFCDLNAVGNKRYRDKSSGIKRFLEKDGRVFKEILKKNRKNSKMEELIAANQLFCFLLFGEVSDIRKWSIQ